MGVGILNHIIYDLCIHYVITYIYIQLYTQLYIYIYTIYNIRVSCACVCCIYIYIGYPPSTKSFSRKRNTEMPKGPQQVATARPCQPWPRSAVPVEPWYLGLGYNWDITHQPYMVHIYTRIYIYIYIYMPENQGIYNMIFGCV